MNVFRSSRLLLTFWGACLLLVACGSPANKPTGASLSSARAEIYARDKVEFSEAAFYKPTDTWMDELGVKLAPLLMQEVKASGSATERFGRLVSNEKKLQVDTNQPTLYFQKEKIQLKGVERDQVVFLWFHQNADRIVPQGVRITLDSDEHPALWEILHDTSGVKQIFASQSLEAIASRQFGTSMPGRRFTLERGIEDAPDIAVSRVISDGPMTMGPAIYLHANHHDVATLICRCMSPQAKNVVANHTYEVADMSNPTIERMVKQALRNSTAPVEHWLNEGAEEIELRLRLPDKF